MTKVECCPRLTEVGQLSQGCRARLCHLLGGVPCMDKTWDGKTLSGTDILSCASASCCGRRTSHRRAEHRTPGTRKRLFYGTPLQKIRNLARSGNRRGLRRCLSVVYRDYCECRQKAGLRLVSRSRFYEELLWSLLRYKVSEKPGSPGGYPGHFESKPIKFKIKI